MNISAHGVEGFWYAYWFECTPIVEERLYCYLCSIQVVFPTQVMTDTWSQGVPGAGIALPLLKFTIQIATADKRSEHDQNILNIDIQPFKGRKDGDVQT